MECVSHPESLRDLEGACDGVLAVKKDLDAFSAARHGGACW